jgi:hypothetical protein
MLIHDFTYVEAPYEAVRHRLASGAEAWLTPLAVRAADAGEALGIRIGPAGDMPLLSLTTGVSVGEAIACGDAVLVPITWQATGRIGAALPVLSADLEVVPLGEQATQLTLMGHYEPPFGALGRGLDRLLLHRMVQASVRSFLDGVAGALEAPGRARAG